MNFIELEQEKKGGGRNMEEAERGVKGEVSPQ